jgi:hypothetical protein
MDRLAEQAEGQQPDTLNGQPVKEWRPLLILRYTNKFDFDFNEVIVNVVNTMYLKVNLKCSNGDKVGCCFEEMTSRWN